MQRKNSILKSTYKSIFTSSKHFSKKNIPSRKFIGKSAFAMIMAISVIVVIAGIMAISLSLTTKTTKRTTDLYLYEQAQIYAKSATEYTLLQIANSAPCSLDKVNIAVGIYDFNVSILYIYTAPSPCNAVGTATSYFDINTNEQNGSVLLDTTITINDPTVVSEPIRYFRRTIQKL